MGEHPTCTMTVPAAELFPGDDIVQRPGAPSGAVVIEPGAIWREDIGAYEVCLRTTGKHQQCFSAYMHPDTPVDIERPNLQLPGLDA